MMSLSSEIISLPRRTIRALPGMSSVPSAFGFPPPKANHPVPSLSMTTPGSKGVLQRPSPGVLPEMRLLPSGSVHGPRGEVEVMTPTPPPLLEKYR